MPKSSRRGKKKDYISATTSDFINQDEVSPRWVPITMTILFIIGLLWLVLFYIAGQDIPIMKNFGNIGNVGIGFAFIVVGFTFASRWK